MAAARKKTEERNVMKAAGVSLFIGIVFFGGLVLYSKYQTPQKYLHVSQVVEKKAEQVVAPAYPPLDKHAYDDKLLFLAHRAVATTTATTTASTTKHYLWPVKTAYPNDGAILPFNRIIAYYGNFYSTKMGVLGEYPTDVVIQKLEAEVNAWKQADPSTPVIPAVHYIATVAQGSAGSDGDYTARMPATEIGKALDMAKKIHGIVFLDIQIGQSTLLKELNAVLPYMKDPIVNLGLDPEFAMPGNRKPGTYIGTLDAAQINEAIQILSRVVEENHLPPKVLVIHRFTENMVTNANLIKPTKEVQVVMNMDGWGTAMLKTGIYRQVITNEPVQFAGVKLFYKNDLKPPSTGMLTPEQILKFTPAPSYIQYQ